MEPRYLVLPCGGGLKYFSVDINKYHTFYTPQKIKEYEAHLERKGLL